MVEVKPRDIRCHTHVKVIIDGDNVGDDDGTNSKPLISLPCFVSFCLSFSVLF